MTLWRNRKQCSRRMESRQRDFNLYFISYLFRGMFTLATVSIFSCSAEMKSPRRTLFDYSIVHLELSVPVMLIIELKYSKFLSFFIFLHEKVNVCEEFNNALHCMKLKQKRFLLFYNETPLSGSTLVAWSEFNVWVQSMKLVFIYTRKYLLFF